MITSMTMWLAVGERGLSSEAIALTALGLEPTGFRASWPHDPADLRRCLLLLEAVPETRQNGLHGPGQAVSEMGRPGEGLGPPVGDACAPRSARPSLREAQPPGPTP